MRKDLKEIYYAFNGKLVGTKRMQKYVCETLSLMPASVVRRITSNCWFMSSMDDAFAFTFTGNDLKNQHLIFLSDDLMRQASSQIKYTIAHEIGHVILAHRNSTLVRQEREEIRRQEKEAELFAQKYIV